MKQLLSLWLLAAVGSALAEAPRQIGDRYAAAAGATFRPSAQRGAELYSRKFGVSEKMDSCASCHTAKPEQAGRHTITGKEIRPLSPQASAERLSEPAKVEKWFRRNCREVIGRECSAAEKADFIAYLTEGR